MENPVQMKTVVRIQNYGQFLSSQVFGMFRDKRFTDCSISAGGQIIEAHRIVLASASPYLQSLLDASDAYNSHPIIVLNEISFNEVCNVLSFIYTGDVTVSFEGIVHFKAVAKHLQLKGIEGFRIDLKKASPKKIVEEVSEKQRVKSSEVSENQGVKSSESRSNVLPISSDAKSLERSARSASLKKASFDSVDSSSETSESEIIPKPRKRKRHRSGQNTNNKPIPCKFCKVKYYVINTLKNHQRYCVSNPNRTISRCPICKLEVKPGSMTYHKRHVHGYSPCKS